MFREQVILILCSNVEPKDSISYKTVCAPSEDSDQPAHVQRLIIFFAIRLKTLSILDYP